MLRRAIPFLLLFFAVACVLLAALADARMKQYRTPSARYRYHAIPVALSQIYFNHPHDYTAIHELAMRFQSADTNPEPLLKAATKPGYSAGTGIYFWVADDRGLSDFVHAAFRIFGPRLHSLNKMHITLLLLSMLFFWLGYRHSPMLLLPVFTTAFGWLVLVELFPIVPVLPFGADFWKEAVTLAEPRLFDGLAWLSWLHLLLLLVRVEVARATFFSAIPQLLLWLVLFHARSSLGWQMLAFFIIAFVQFVHVPVLRKRIALLACCGIAALVALKQYQKQMYHPEYFAERGNRTFWHNAIMGLHFQPTLRETIPLPQCADVDAVRVVLSQMYLRESDLDKNNWNEQACLNSLGGHNAFDWPRYEREARAAYWDLWPKRPMQMMRCYAFDKPREIARQSWHMAKQLGNRIAAGEENELYIGIPLLLLTLGIVARLGRSELTWHADARTLSHLLLVAMCFSLIPAIAFYPAITTLSCFYLLLSAWLCVNVLRLYWRCTKVYPVH